MNRLDYRLSLVYFSDGEKNATITVRNGIPESSTPPEWLERGEMSTVPEIFSFIKKEEKRIKKDNRSISLVVRYNDDYHYPRIISGYRRGGIQNSLPAWDWNITVIPW
jgi:hypothetical protein